MPEKKLPYLQSYGGLELEEALFSSVRGLVGCIGARAAMACVVTALTLPLLRSVTSTGVVTEVTLVVTLTIENAYLLSGLIAGCNSALGTSELLHDGSKAATVHRECDASHSANACRASGWCAGHQQRGEQTRGMLQGVTGAAT